MQFKESEEKLEKGVEEKLGQGATAVGDAVKTAGAGDNLLSGNIPEGIPSAQACTLLVSAIVYWWCVACTNKHTSADKPALASIKSCVWVLSWVKQSPA